jgi:hypothetical protein
MDPASPTRDGTCHVLRLSPELRSPIFDWALSTPNGVICKAIKYDSNVLYRFREVADLDMLLVCQVQ